MKERLQKILAARGVCSRRAAEELLRDGRVKVNGMTALLGETADPDADEILIDDAPLPASEQYVYLMLNKPRGYVTTMSDEAGRPDVTSLVRDIPQRVYPVGRLDMHSEGLLIMTNDGDMAYRLMHPRHNVSKQYLVKMTKASPDAPDDPTEVLSQPLSIEGHLCRAAEVRVLHRTPDNGYVLTIAIKEGRNRQIRRMCVQCGYTVNALKRVAEGKLKLGDLKVGTYRHLTAEEIAYLKTL